jgi:hypothetical protein
MTRSEAEKLMESLLQCQKELDKAVVTAHDIEDEKERLELKKAITSAIGIIFTDAILVIAQQYPDLNPYK